MTKKPKRYVLCFASGFVAVLQAAMAHAVDFDTEIIPILTRSGCNAGACHGAAAGRGEFRLSLFGGDPAADFDSIVREFEGRRINLARPKGSLLIAKPTGQLAHGGDVALDQDSEGARELLAWIESGATRSAHRRLIQFEVVPGHGVVESAGAEVPLRASARFDDGSLDDVTQWTVFSAADPASIQIDRERNVATVLRGGQHIVHARFLDRIVPIDMTLPVFEEPVNLAGQPRANFIDDKILMKLELLRVPPAPAADDATYLRRVTLALTGKLPARDEAEQYFTNQASDKRKRLVDRLIASDAFADYWTYRFATLLRIRALPNDRVGAKTYHNWLRDQIRSHAPLDRVARKLLTATGDSHVVGPANFARMSPDARAEAELVSQVFLGARLQCANCHNHPLDRWTQDDYHGLAAIFAKVERGQNVILTSRGAVTNPRTGEPAIPKLPGDHHIDADERGDYRIQFANWLTAPDNSYFARAVVNRLWRDMFGRGLVEPVDDLRDTNPATHPELLERLAADFVEHGYDFRHTLRLIALSETFRRGDFTGGTTGSEFVDDRFYSQALRRLLEPEVLADAIADVTGVFDAYGDEPVGTRAVALFDPAMPSASLDILGRCSRESACEGYSASGGGLPAKLHQLNGEIINRKIASADGRLRRLISSGSSNQAIIEDFYLRALSRYPSEDERKYWEQELAGHDGRERALRLEDFVWSLLNCSEFTTNH
jgi:hypothetical protein